MIKKFYDKNELWFSIIWIIAYCALACMGDNLSDALGITKVITLPILLLLSVILFLFIKRNNLTEKYGFCRADVAASKMLFYIPVIILLTANMWHGFRLNMSPFESILYVLSMLCVGFLEELIFRGLLFNAMLINGKNSAIIVSSVTFGVGHIINLINGSGAELLSNLLQVVYAIAVGFMFVMIYYRTKSLLPCIITHGVFNALSAFANETGLTSKEQIISCILITLISSVYGLYIALSKEFRHLRMNR
jgi:membrane protease YdiL (CAAX protease family)